MRSSLLIGSQSNTVNEQLHIELRAGSAGPHEIEIAGWRRRPAKSIKIRLAPTDVAGSHEFPLGLLVEDVGETAARGRGGRVRIQHIQLADGSLTWQSAEK